MKRGFTIIELLIVIAIIGLISSIIFTNTANTRARSRDARREADIKEIQNALFLYAANSREFPLCDPEVIISGRTDCLSTQLLAAGAMAQVPVDPLGGALGTCGEAQSYVYCYFSNATTYMLRHHLETDSISGKAPGWHTVSP